MWVSPMDCKFVCILPGTHRVCVCVCVSLSSCPCPCPCLCPCPMTVSCVLCLCQYVAILPCGYAGPCCLIPPHLPRPCCFVSCPTLPNLCIHSTRTRFCVCRCVYMPSILYVHVSCVLSPYLSPLPYTTSHVLNPYSLLASHVHHIPPLGTCIHVYMYMHQHNIVMHVCKCICRLHNNACM